MTVLLAEDFSELRVGLAAELRKAGYRVLTASNLAAARRHLQREEPDLALLDIGLGDVADAGLVLCREIRHAVVVTPHLSGMPIILLTSCGGEEGREVGLTAGADLYLVKPVSFNAVVEAVATSLRNRRGSQAPAVPSKASQRRPVLVVEDQDEDAKLITDYLHGGGYLTIRARTIDEARHALPVHNPGLVVLDLKLGDDWNAGLRFLYELRAGGQLGLLRAFCDLPVVLLTERENLGLASGDPEPRFSIYFSKRMFLTGPGIFLTNIRTYLPPDDAPRETVEFGPIRIHRRQADVWVAGRHLTLPNQQYVVLLALVEAQGEPVSRTTLCARAVISNMNHLRPPITRLRATLKGAAPELFGSFDPIRNYRGSHTGDDGYRLVLPPQLANA